jgi:hypothetical protein
LQHVESSLAVEFQQVRRSSDVGVGHLPDDSFEILLPRDRNDEIKQDAAKPFASVTDALSFQWNEISEHDKAFASWVQHIIPD